jgi:RNA polymerase sigma-70 factor (ECF subfamily)
VDIMRQAQIPQIAPVESGDTELVRRALARDESGVRAIMQANNRRLYRLARGILRNDSEAEDVVQEPMSAPSPIWRVSRRFQPSTWLSRIAMNEALGRLRRQRPASNGLAAAGALEAQIIQFPLRRTTIRKNPWPSVKFSSRRARHRRTPPKAFRIVFITRVIEGMNVEETAEILGLKPETVKNQTAPRPHHAARQCRKENRPCGHGAFPFAGKRCERLTEAVLKRLGASA